MAIFPRNEFVPKDASPEYIAWAKEQPASLYLVSMLAHHIGYALPGTTPTDPNTTPAAPAFTGFNDSTNTVTLVPATGVPMSDYRYALPGSNSFVNTPPANGVISVGDVAGPVQAYSVAATGRNQSPVASSPAFTAAPVAPTFNRTLINGQSSDGIEFIAAEGWKLLFNAPAPASGALPINMSLFAGSTEFGASNFFSGYAGAQFGIESPSGTRYYKNFPSQQATINVQS